MCVCLDMNHHLSYDMIRSTLDSSCVAFWHLSKAARLKICPPPGSALQPTCAAKKRYSLSVYVSEYLYTFIYVSLYLNISKYLSIPSIHSSVHPSILPSIHLSLSISTSIYIYPSSGLSNLPTYLLITCILYIYIYVYITYSYWCACSCSHSLPGLTAVFLQPST